MTSPIVTFTIPGEPQGKGRAKFGKGRTYTPSKTVAYEGVIALAAQQTMFGRPPLAGPVRMVIDAFLSIPTSASRKKRAAMLAGSILPTKKPDFDNIAKAVCDGCNKVVFQDDAQVVSATVNKRYGETPGVTVCVFPENKA